MVVIALAVPALHAGDEPHLGGPIGDFLAHCPFAHGYLHGYEEGFHIGDSDFHLGRERDGRAVLQQKANDGYRATFGDRSSFRFGFRQGVVAGYNDSISGREFRAYEALQAYSPTAESLKFSDLDRGVGDGYMRGYSNGMRSLASDEDFDADPAPCPSRSAGDGSLPPSSRAYCDGFAKAYAIGYRDAYLSREERGTQVAARR
jgi:hypothetical protein